MFKGRFFQSYWLRLGLKMVVWEAVVLMLSWLLFRWLHWLKNFGDVLLLVGVLEVMAASVGMMGRPYEVSNSPWGVLSSSVQPSERERREQAIAEYIEKRSFSMRLIASGLLTILASLLFYYVI
ncbi:MAG TPA: hypothetical protein VMT46_16030 [Anaerolineaceae bacterium]|nr:hypothetical protein [Anaerolineaceae bacterium]